MYVSIYLPSRYAPSSLLPFPPVHFRPVVLACPPLHVCLLIRYYALNYYSPWNEVDPQWLVGLMFPKELELFASSCKRMREHCKMIMKRKGDNWDPRNPKSFLEYYMATR